MAQEFKIGRLRYTWAGNWETATFYNRDAVAAFDGKTYVCIVPHTSSVFYNDYTNVEESGEINPYWVLMLEGQTWKGDWEVSTEYTLGAIVLYGGTLYKCITNHNSGLVFDFTKWSTYVEVDSRWIGNYAPSTFYYKGDTVKYGGIVYRCIIQHTSTSSVTIDETKWETVHIGIEFKGQWNPDTVNYRLNDIVKYGPDLWICQEDHTSSSTFLGTMDLEDTDTIWKIWIPGLEFGNSWSEETLYQPGDTVLYGGYSFVSNTVNNINNIPSLTSDDWTLVTTGYSYQQEWLPGTSYKIGAVVRRGANIFSAIRDNVNQDPTGDVVNTTYTAAGSSGTTLVVADTTGIVPGMFITGPGFNKGQIVTTVEDLTTLTISEAPYSSIGDNAGLQFSGVNDLDWLLISPSVRWRNRWSDNASYVVGDVAVWVNITYKCIRTHTASNANRPDLDTTNVYWITFLNHDKNNVLNLPGDIIVNSNGNNIALNIGSEGYLLKSVQGVPTWSSFLQTPAVYYVTPNGTDVPGSGNTWDNPYGSINYACQQVLDGVLNTGTRQLLSVNKTFMVEETYQWMLYQIENEIFPFINDPIIDQDKTKRDSRFLIDAIIYDLSRGGNSQIVAFTLSFFDKVGQYQYATPEVAAQIEFFIATINKVFDVTSLVSSNTLVTSYQSINNVPAPVAQEFGVPASAQTAIDIESYRTIVITALTEGDTSTIPRENAGLTATIQVKTGTYYETLPIVIPANTALNGDELRGVVVYPKVIINTIVTRSSVLDNKFTCKTTEGMVDGLEVQFDSIGSVNTVNSVFGGVTRGVTYYVVGSSITETQFSVRDSFGVTITLENFTSQMRVYGGDALKDMFRCQNGTGIRNMTLSGLLGTLTEENEFLTRRPTGGAYVSLDPGFGPDDTKSWIYRKSPYIQNVTTFGVGATGLKIDGSLHNGGNKSIVCNDFTQIISDGIGIWCTGTDSLCEAVSVFSYYAYAGYFAEAGGRIRATNGNSSYGTFGVVAEGFDDSEIPISGFVDNQYYEATATPFSSLGTSAEILKIQYSHAGENYVSDVTNLLRYSNGFTNWSSDSNVTLVQSIVSPFGFSDAWIATGNTSGTDSSYLFQNNTITASGAQYTALSGVNIVGAGTGATFDVIVTSTQYIVSINAGGNNYVATNQIRILGSQLGGINDINDLIITVTGLSGTAVATISTTGTVPEGSTQHYTYSLYVKKGTAPVVDLSATFTGYQSVTSLISFNFLNETITPFGVDSGMMPTEFSATPVTSAEGWYRLAFQFYDTTALNTTLQVRIYPRSKLGNAGFTLIYGSQLELGDELGFYLESTTGRYTAYANYKVVGPGQGAVLVGDEIRASSVFKTRLLEVDRVTGGTGYLLSTNNAQAGDSTSITIAASDVVGEKPYLGMRVFVNSGTGAGQYGTISFFDTVSKVATVLKESFSQIETVSSSASTDAFTISINDDINSLYVDQPVQFVPTTYDIDAVRVSQSSIDVLSTQGGTVNQLTVTSTAQLAVNMPINFSGTTYGGVTSGFTYYITAIIDEIKIQVSTTLGGAVQFLNTNTGDMQLNYPNNTSYIVGDTTEMSINLPIYFTGSVLSSIEAGQTYYINEIFSSDEFTISAGLANPVATATTAVSNIVSVDATDTLVSLNPVIFTGTGFGNIEPDTKYFINHIVNGTSITLAENVVTTSATITNGTSDLITVDSTTGFVIGNPVIFTGTTFGGIVNDQVYYINYVNNSTSFAISNVSNALSVTVTDTTATSNRLTVASNSNLTPLVPITFSGTVFGSIVAGTQYFINRIFGSTEFTVSPTVLSRTATATVDVSNLITVDDTTGFVSGNPIIFGGETFGNIVSGVVYYVSAVNDSTSFTISSAPGGAAFTLAPGTGIVTCRTTNESVTLTTASGSMVGTSRFVGTAQAITTGVGNCIVRTTSSTLELTTDTGTLTGTTTTLKETLESDSGSMRGTFSVPLFGGVSTGTTYYVRTITTGSQNTFTITDSVGGATNVSLVDGTGSMKMGHVGWDHINPGTPLAASFDSTTVYSIEPRIFYSKPAFSINSSSTIAQPLTTTYVSIAFGNGKYVALPNENATLAVSTNGLEWTEQLLPVAGTWKDITYGNGYWVIISTSLANVSSSRVLYSNSELVTWKSSFLPLLFAGTWNKVIYGNGVFIAVPTDSQQACAISDTNGSTWNSASSLPGPARTTSDVAYGAGTFVAISNNSAVVSYITDTIGGIWSTSTLPRSTTWSSVAYGNGRFVAISSTLGKAAYSFDGITWYDSLYNVAGTTITYGNGVFLAVGYEPTGGIIFTSEDGVTWDTRSASLNVRETVFGITSNVGRFVSVSGNVNSFVILAGSRTKARPVVVGEKITEINEWETGSNYTLLPTVTIVDTNATVLAEVTPLTGSGVLSNPTFVNRGSGYNTNTTTITITGGGYADDFQTGITLICNNLSRLPSPGDNLAIEGDDTIYKVTAAVALDGTVPPNVRASIDVSPEITVGLSPDHLTPISIRTKYSQARLTNHDYLNIGFGNFEESNYPRLPLNTVLSPQNETVESNYGRVFYSSTDQDGNFRVGELFAVEQATGIVTLSASQFGLDGLNELKLGGVAIGGSSVIITQFSTDSTFVANSNNIIPTQKAIKSYLSARLTQGGSNTFTGQLIAGTVLVGGPDKISSTVPEGGLGSRVKMTSPTKFSGVDGGMWDGDGMALQFFFKSLIADRGVENGQ
jgi:hypothetical protein